MKTSKSSKHKTGIELSLHLFNSKNTVTLRLSGYSMFPFLREGDVGCIAKCDIELLKIGDIIVFKSENKFIAHRLLKKEFINNEYVLTTKGDTSPKNDPSFTNQLYVGKLVNFNRNKKMVNLQTNFHSFYGYLIAKTSKINTPAFVLNKKIFKRFKLVFL